jgi:hypothetical protein
MPRKRKSRPVARLDDTWIKTPHLLANGRHIYPGTELSITGERGRFRFHQHVLTPDGREWIDCFGGARWRSFRVDRIKRVHRKTTGKSGLTT